jgi:hypothetical protein
VTNSFRLTSFSRTVLSIFFIFTFLLSQHSPLSAECCCCSCEDDAAGIWWSRGAGRMALIAGGVVILGAAAGAIAGYSASKGHCSSRSNGPSADVVPPVNVPQPVVSPYYSSSYCSSDYRAKAPQKTSSLSEQDALTIHFDLSMDSASHDTLVAFPFVTCPDGSTVEGAPVYLSQDASQPNIAPLIISSPAAGTYAIGARYSSKGNVKAMPELETIIVSSKDGSTKILRGAVVSDGKISSEFIYEANQP